MQTTAETPAAQADAAKAITALRKRLARWELDHLRHHCADLAQRLDDALGRVDTLESEVSRAWDAADSWREQTTELVNDLQEAGKTVGLTMDGALVVMPQAAAETTAVADAITNALVHAFTPIGTHLPAEGGTLGAIIARRDGTTYGLIVADAAHDVTGTWGEYGQDVPGAKGPDGAANTQAMAAAGSPIVQAVRALNIEGHADWFIPSRMQMLALYETSPDLFDKDSWYWTSSQYSRSHAWCQDFEYGSSSASDEDDELRARPVRSIQLQPFTPSQLPQPIAEGDPREILGTEVAA
ncbi:DUF1566 domain-containing protein [Acidovorax sp. Leaf73]|uniref:Lcl domain-containing protein n=1 Tax=Acidovorax sp. Leaf73 TaxID=2876566 RepID=UPI001E5AFECD|nr:DUF1566 domain-containing protein [Acidovorax sp. Leaf73]